MSGPDKIAKIVIVDYGLGNLRSVQKALARLGAVAEISQDHAAIAKANALVLPGVGSFADGMARLRHSGLDRAILAHMEKGRPLLGICLGLQLLFETGYEDGCHRGLGWFKGDVVRLPNRPGFKVPHMGWNTIRYQDPHNTFGGVEEGSYFYFVHSYHVEPQDRQVISTLTDHGGDFVSSVWQNKVLATQFHPEKSQLAGSDLLRFFLSDVANLPLASEQLSHGVNA